MHTLSIWYSQFSSDLFPAEMAGFVSFIFEWTQWEIRSERGKKYNEKQGLCLSVLYDFNFRVYSFGNVNLCDKWNHRSAETTNCERLMQNCVVSGETTRKNPILSGFSCAKLIFIICSRLTFIMSNLWFINCIRRI